MAHPAEVIDVNTNLFAGMIDQEAGAEINRVLAALPDMFERIVRPDDSLEIAGPIRLLTTISARASIDRRGAAGAARHTACERSDPTGFPSNSAP
jgi:hypothetical protein